MSQRILVTGGSGYLGTHLRRYFGADDFSRRSGHDITSSEDAACVSEYDAVIHMAASVDKHAGAERACFDTNVAGTVNLLRHLRKAQAFLFLSTKEVYGRHADVRQTVDEECPIDRAMGPYEWSKLMAEQCVEYYAARAGARAAVFRLSTTYAPVTSGNKGTFVNFFAEAVRNGQTVQLKSKGQQVRDFLHVDDLIRAVERFLLSHIQAGSPSAFNIGGGVPNSTTLVGLMEILGELTGRPPVVELDDTPATGQARYVTDISRGEQILGWSPQRTLREGLQTIL